MHEREKGSNNEIMSTLTVAVEESEDTDLEQTEEKQSIVKSM